MLNAIVLASTISCAPVQFKNKTDIWDAHDKKILEYAVQKCRKIPENPCLKIFIKVEERVYNFICGLTKDK